MNYSIGKKGPNSTFLEGDVEKFKQSLDEYLRKDFELEPYLSPYRPAHIDRFHRKMILFDQFRVEDLKTMNA